MLFLNTFQ